MGIKGRRSRAFTLIELLVVMAVLAILMGMLLPALAAGREKARRAVCMANLNQFGKALASYSSDYNEYFPSTAKGNGNPAIQSKLLCNDQGVSPNGWASLSAPAAYRDAGVVSDGRSATTGFNSGYSAHLPRYVGSQELNYTPGLYWRQIGLFRGGAARTSLADFTAGRLNNAPLGAGFLFDGGYLADARVFYCPTVAESLPAVSGRLCSGRAWQTLGGYDRDTFRYGDYSRFATFYVDDETVAHPTYGISSNADSHYAYRNIPCAGWRAGDYVRGPGWVNGSPAPGRLLYPVPLTRPSVYFPSDNAMFPTTKLLGGRAIMSDAFGSRSNTDADGSGTSGLAMVGGLPLNADGWYGHRNGYNVLYGDFAARWFADAPMQVIWWTGQFHANAAGYSTDVAWNESGRQVCTAQAFFNPEFQSMKSMGGLVIWHRFDQLGSIDTVEDLPAEGTTSGWTW